MRACLATILLLLGHPLPAAQNGASPLIRCLGQEELEHHKRHNMGPNYQLNQYLLNTMAGANELALAQGMEEKICQHPKLPPSVSLLRELLINGLSIFNIPKEQMGGHSQSMNILWALESELPLTFFNYLSSLQSYAKDPKCLEKFIPELPYFMERTKYLESDVPNEELLTPREKLVSIFVSIEGIDSIYKRCLKSQENSRPKAKPQATKEKDPLRRK